MPNLNYKDMMERAPVVLTLKIDNSQPLRLASFVKSLTTLAAEYERAVRDNDDFEDADAEVFIKEIRTGSIIADLIPVATSVAPLVASEIEQIGLAVDFINNWKKRLGDLAKGIIPAGTTKSDLRHYLNTVESIARDPDATSRLEAATFEDGKRQVRASLQFTTQEAKRIERVIEGEFKRLEDKKHADYERVLMVFTRSDVGDAPLGKKSGEKVLIEEISPKTLAITYGSELAEQRIKHEIRETDDNVYKKGFSVDVKQQSVGGRPVAYSILAVHEVIDLPD